VAALPAAFGSSTRSAASSAVPTATSIAVAIPAATATAVAVPAASTSAVPVPAASTTAVAVPAAVAASPSILSPQEGRPEWHSCCGSFCHDEQAFERGSVVASLVPSPHCSHGATIGMSRDVCASVFVCACLRVFACVCVCA